MRMVAYHGTTAAGLDELRGFPGRNEGYLCGLGAWLSEDPRVAEFFARLRGAATGLPMFVYEAEVEFGEPRAYEVYAELRLDLALNPLRCPKVFGDYEAWERDGCPERAEPDAALDHDAIIERFRRHLVSCGTTAICIERSTTDLPIVRRDVCALVPSAARLLACHHVVPGPEGTFADHRDLGRWLASCETPEWAQGHAFVPRR